VNTTTTIELWAPTLTFNGRPAPFPIRYRAPRDTTDPRWQACHEHRTACDCREAEWAEQLAELRSEAHLVRLMEEAIDAVLAIHRKGDHGGCRGCLHRYPCPTRNLVAHLSWLETWEAKR